MKSVSDAVFLGWQETLSGMAIALYNITSINHPSFGSTVTDRDLRELNLKIPKRERYIRKEMNDEPLKAEGLEVKKMKDKWEFYQDAEQHWRWRRTSPNGNIVGASSEGYTNKADCLGNARRNGWKE